MGRAFLIVGSNLGNRQNLLEEASKAIQKEVGSVLNQSSIYETAPWGFKHSTNFLNQVLEIETSMDPLTLLHHLNQIEEMFGRKREGAGYTARSLDIDILFYNNSILKNDDLIIPHPRIAKRKFVLIPLCELIPSFVHPVLKKTVEQLLHLCDDESDVVLFNTS